MEWTTAIRSYGVNLKWTQERFCLGGLALELRFSACCRLGPALALTLTFRSAVHAKGNPAVRAEDPLGTTDATMWSGFNEVSRAC